MCIVAMSMNTRLVDRMRMVLGGLAKFDSWLGVDMDAIITLGESGGGRLDINSLRTVVGMYVGATNVGEIDWKYETFSVTEKIADYGDTVFATFYGAIDRPEVIEFGAGRQERTNFVRNAGLRLESSGNGIVSIAIRDFGDLIELLVQLWPGGLPSKRRLTYLTKEPILWHGKKNDLVRDWGDNIFLRYRVYMEVSQFENIFCDYENLQDIDESRKRTVKETVLMIFDNYNLRYTALSCIDLINSLLGKLVVDRSKLTVQESRDLIDRLNLVSEQRARRWGTWGVNKTY